MSEIDLTHLREISDGDNEFIIEMVNIFLKNGVEDMEKLRLANENKERDQVAKLAHKLKSSLTIFALNDALSDALKLEDVEAVKDQGEINDLVNSLGDKISTTTEKMKALLKDLHNQSK